MGAMEYQKVASGEGSADNSAVARTVKLDSPHWYLAKCIFVYLLVVADIFLNSAINSTTYNGLVDERMAHFWAFLGLVVQTSLQIFIFLTLFLLMCNTYLMQIGLPGVVLSDFKLLGIVQVVYLVLTLILGIMRVLRSDDNRALSMSEPLWTMKGFSGVFVIQNLAAGFYYHQVLVSTFRLADEKYYTKSGRPMAIVPSKSV